MEIEVIQDLIKMDEDTRNRINNAHELKYKLKQAIEQEKKKLTDEAWANVETQVKSMREEIRTTHEKRKRCMRRNQSVSQICFMQIKNAGFK